MATASRTATDVIVVTPRLPASALAILRQAGDVRVEDDASRPLAERVAGATALVCLLTDPVTGAVIEAAGPGLRVIANVAVGYDNVDLAAARARGIVVTNTPGVLTEAVAEFTWALILGITRRIGEGERLVRRGAWTGWALDQLPGMQLAGKQLGIVGAGRIGRRVAARSGAFGMSVVFAGRRAGGTIDDHPVVSIDALLVSSDVVSLHVPLRPETRHLINRRTLARMKRSAYLINTARGAVVDEEALVWALGEGLIAGAALDVYEREPDVPEALRTRENVLLAPHLGSATRETRTAMAELAAHNVADVLAGRPARTPVDA